MIDLTHSPLGASGMDRWQACPGSAYLVTQHKLVEAEEPGFRVDGSVAHAGAAACLESGADAWEIIGNTFDIDGQHRAFTGEMADAVQVYLDFCRSITQEGDEVFVEHHFEDPDVHPLFRGTVDYAVLSGDCLRIVDYKHGCGVFVDVKKAQTKYYAAGMLRHPDAVNVDAVERTIVQPRIPWAPGGPIRSVMGSADEIQTWQTAELVPAMHQAQHDKSLNMGEHCRFCPAMLVCPATSATYRAMASADDVLVHMSDQTLDQEYAMTTAVRMRIKKIEEEAFRRVACGHELASCKLVQQKADRVFKDGAEDRFKAELGQAAYAAPKLLSPAQMEKVNGDAKKLVAEWAYKPDTGFTLAPRADSRAEVKPSKASDIFKHTLLDLENNS